MARDPGTGDVWAQAITDSAGLASLFLETSAGRAVLRAELAGRASSGERTVHLDEPRLDEDADGIVRLVLHPFVRLTGRVETDSGSPVSGAAVTVRTRGVVIGGSACAAAGPVLTDRDGVFEIELDGVPCRVAVEAHHDVGSADPASIMLPGAAAEPVRLVIRESRYEISGLVRAADGCDAAGALVLLLPLEPRRPPRSVEATPEGAFSFLLDEPGEQRLAARNGACSSAVPLLVLTEDARRSVHVELSLERTLDVSGRIVSPEGEPWAGIPVGGHPASSVAQDPWLLEQGFLSLASLELTHTDADGAFRLEGLHAGYLYELVCVPDPSRPDCWVRERSVRPGTSDLLIVVDEARIRGGVLAVTILRGAQREPVHAPSFLVHERHPGRDAWGGRTRAPIVTESELRFEGLVLGNEYFVQVHAPDAAPLSIGPWIATEEERRAELVFGLDGALEARVHLADGRHAEGVVVSLIEEGEGPRHPIRKRPRATDGVARFAPLAAGRYRASVERGETVVGPFDVDIHAGALSELRIEVDDD